MGVRRLWGLERDDREIRGRRDHEYYKILRVKIRDWRLVIRIREIM